MSRRSHPLLRFVVLTFGIAWGIGLCLALFPAQVSAVFGSTSLSNPLVMFAVCAPSISALALTAVARGPTGVRGLLSRLVRWRVGVHWYAAVLIGIPALSALARLLHGAAAGSVSPVEHWYDLILLGPSGREVIQLVLASHAGPLAVIPALFAVFLFIDPGPLGEELGWRGYALPLLLRRRSPLWAGLILGAIWGVWHLPAFVIAGLPQNHFSLPLFMVNVVAFSVLQTWVFKGTGGSVLFAVLGHAMVNLCVDLVTMPLASAVVLALAALTVVCLDGAMRQPTRTLADGNASGGTPSPRPDLAAQQTLTAPYWG